MDAKERPATVSELYPSPWLRADDLQGRTVTVTVGRVAIEDIRQRDGETQPRAVLAFAGKRKRLILNKTQCEAMASATGSERFDDWTGATVTLRPGTAPNGKPTVIVERGDHD